MVNITIFNPNDKIYGKLSNNYLYWMNIDKTQYPSVTNYIYSNMLTKLYIKAQLSTFLPVKDVYKKFLELLTLEKNTIIKMAVEIAYKSKFNDPELSDKLLSTKHAPLLYMGNDNFLGLGTDRNGFNMIGKYLMQLRRQKQLNVKDKEKYKLQEQKDKELYDIYIVYKALENKIVYEKDNLREYIGKTPQQIMVMMGKDKLLENAPSPENVRKHEQLRLIPNELYVAINKPTILAEIVRKKELENLRLYQIERKKRIILEMYIDYILAKNYSYLTPEQYPKAREQQLRKIGLQNLSELQNRTQKYYEEGLLSERLSKNIDDQLVNIHIPSEEDIEAAKLIVFTEDDDKKEDIIPQHDPEKPIEIYPQDNIFSPIDDSVLIQIDKYLYPSVAHYIMTYLLSNIPRIGNIPNAYAFIIDPKGGPVKSKANFYDIDLINKKYDEIYREDFVTRLIANMQIGLNKKFENREYQNLLLITENSKLLWGEKDDIILGIGTKQHKGENQVGKYLEQLRTNIKSERVGEDIVTFTTDNINEVLTDPLMTTWIQMRLNDICHIIYAVQNYIQTKIGEKVKLTPILIESIIDQIYQPCSHIYTMVDEVNAEVPHNFRVMVQKCPGFSSVSHDIIEIIWKRIVVMIYYLVKYAKDSSIVDLRQILSTIENLVSTDNNCVDLLGTNMENCTLSALVNLLRNIHEFNSKKGYSTEITKQDIELVTTIILGKDISDEITPVVQKPKYFIDARGKKQQIITEDDEFILAKQEAKKIGDKRVQEYWDIIEGDVEGDVEGDDVPDNIPEFYIEPDDEGDDEGGDDEGGDDEGDDEYWDDDPTPSEDGDDYFSVKADNYRLIKLLETIPNITNIPEIIELLSGAVEIIKVYRMPERIKNNRINFFATQL